MNKLYMTKGMRAPVDLILATNEEIRDKKLNNCGPGGPLNSVIPDSLLGVDISTSCNIHDWTYLDAKNERDHQRSDYLFLKNMKTQVNEEQHAHPVLKYMRYGLAYIYYGAVRMYSFFKKTVPQNINKKRRKVLK